jgi:FKBP-type peptidyl-prolyl cis-trans isomerase FklB
MIVKRAGWGSRARRTDGGLLLPLTRRRRVTLPSGLQYKVLTTGTGGKPTLEDNVVCQYRLSLVGGKEVDSSGKRGQPFTIPVKSAIKGWTEVLQLMPVGSKWEVFVPPSLGYGERGAGADIGPNATLIFEIELVAIK